MSRPGHHADAARRPTRATAPARASASPPRKPAAPSSASSTPATFGACTSPQPYSGLAAGSHTFQVRATDGAGNVDPSPASFTWTVDLTHPGHHADEHAAGGHEQRRRQLQLHGVGGWQYFRLSTRWRRVRRLFESESVLESGRRQSHLPGPRHRWRGERRPLARQLHLVGRLDRPRHEPDGHAADGHEQRRHQLQLHGDGGRELLRVQARRRDVRRLYEPAALLRPRRRQPYLPGPGHRRRQQRRPLARQFHLDRRSRPPRTRP